MIRKAFPFLLLTFFATNVFADEKVSFARDIRPILNAKCTSCHGGVKQAGGVSFVYKDQVVDFAGDSGNLVVKPGDADVSELFFRVTLLHLLGFDHKHLSVPFQGLQQRLAGVNPAKVVKDVLA
jgi:hypothetical protein